MPKSIVNARYTMSSVCETIAVSEQIMSEVYESTVSSFTDVFSSLKPPDNIDALNESSPGMECFCPPTCSELVSLKWQL